MSYAELVKSWQDAFYHPPPVQCGKALMQGALAWHIQTQSLGGLSPAESKAIIQSRSSLTQSFDLAVGSRLVRVWKEQTHQVSVVERGFEYEGKHYESLSAIAKAITGTPWSGPVFLVLKRTALNE